MVAIEARDFVFIPAAATGPAGVPFTIAFTNSDAAIPHNVELSDAGGSRFSGKIINGPNSINYSVPALPAGTYKLSCLVHPISMDATFTAR